MSLATRQRLLWTFATLNVSILLFQCLRLLFPIPVPPSYTGNDYPVAFDVGPLEPVAMTLHDSIHFEVDPADEGTRKRWLTTVTHPLGMGRVHMGPNNRLFSTTLGHQLHCVMVMEEGLRERNETWRFGHIRHCLNYLRQTFLCAATDSLERGDFVERVLAGDRLGDTLLCWDWERVYEEMGTQWSAWIQKQQLDV